MKGTLLEADFGWELEAFEIDLTLNELMSELDPRWDSWTSREAVAA